MTYKVFYDEVAKNIVVNQTNRVFASGSCVAEADGNFIKIRYSNSDIVDIYKTFDQFSKEDGSPAGSNVSEVLTYLNNEFDKSPYNVNSEQMNSVSILSASRIVKQVDSVVSYASSDDDNSAYTTIGITRTAGTTVTVVKTGELVDPSFSFTANEPLFLNTNGFFSHTPPSSGFILQVGVALSTTKMLVDIGEPLFI